ncbi:hypothetical protein OH687_36195 [Burkholderia anthina]|nr:hypothetical protein OH687_36195 [Burkholderia anthina]
MCRADFAGFGLYFRFNDLKSRSGPGDEFAREISKFAVSV